MSNKAYLCSTDHSDIYPSFGFADYDPAIHTLASGVYCVPLTWLALFGLDSLQTKTFHVPGKDVTEISGSQRRLVHTPAQDVVATAPIASRELCVERVSTGIRRLETLLDLKSGSLREYGDCLRSLVENSVGQYVTIELEEIACMGDENEFYAQLLVVLLWLGGIEKPNAREACMSLGDFDPSRPVFSPTGFYHRKDLTDQDYRNFENLLGSGYIRTTPWEA